MKELSKMMTYTSKSIEPCPDFTDNIEADTLFHHAKDHNGNDLPFFLQMLISPGILIDCITVEKKSQYYYNALLFKDQEEYLRFCKSNERLILSEKSFMIQQPFNSDVRPGYEPKKN